MMHHSRPHHLLQQVPLTVSPFISLPTATTLSYNYRTMPSYIPASGLGIPTYSDATSLQPNTRFIVSSSGHAAHPNDIRESCHALLEHVTQLGQKAERELQEFEAGIRERELVENRRRAPGWLDSNSRLLEPQRMSEQREPVQGREGQGMVEGRNEAAEYDEGAQLDKAFGGLGIK